MKYLLIILALTAIASAECQVVIVCDDLGGCSTITVCDDGS